MGAETVLSGSGVTQGTPTQRTPGAVTPPDAGRLAAIEQQRSAVERSANQNLAFSESGELTPTAQGSLSQLARFLKRNPDAKASLSAEALQKDLPPNPPADAVEKRTAAVAAYLKSLDESGKTVSDRITVGSEPAPAQPAGGTSTVTPPPAAQLKVVEALGDVRIGAHQDGLQTQEITTASGAPQIAVLYRSSDAFAHIIVREPDGTRKIVKVERGVDLSQPLTGADIWTKNEKGEGVKQSGAGTISLTLSAEQKKQIEDTLAKIQQKPAPASSTPPADAAGAQGAGATTPEQGAGATGGSNGQQQGGAGGGGSTPPTGGTQGPGSQPQPSGSTATTAGSLLNDPAAMKAWLKTPGAIDGLRAAFPGRVDAKEGGKVVEVAGIVPNRVVSIDLNTGESRIRKPNAVDTTELTAAQVTQRINDALSKARGGFSVAREAIGTDHTQFTVEDKAAIAKWLQTPGIVPFLKKFYGDGDVRENDKTIQFSHDGVTVTLQKGSGAVMIQKQTGALWWSGLENVTASENTKYVPKVKDQLRDLMILKGMPTR